MTSISKKEFRDYYSELLKSPEAMANGKLSESVYQTFQALGNWKKNQQSSEVTFGNKKIQVAELSPREIQIFAKFAKQYVQINPVEEQYAIPLLENLNAYDEFQTVKRQVLLHEHLETVEATGKPLGEIKAHLTEILKSEQKKAQDLEALDKKNQKKQDKAMRLWGVGVTALGIAVVGGAALAIPFLGPWIGMPIFLLGGVPGAVAIGFGVFMVAAPKQVHRIRSNQESLDLMAKLEGYKKVMQEPEFEDFVAKNWAPDFTTDNEKIFKFFELYDLQKQQLQSSINKQEEIDKLKKEIEN